MCLRDSHFALTLKTFLKKKHSKLALLSRFSPEQDARPAPAEARGERAHPDRQHADGHGQDQGLRLAGEGGAGVAGRRDRARREGEDEGQGPLLH